VLSEQEKAFIGSLDPGEMLTELENPATSHARRRAIGIRLAVLGDPRAGVGLDEAGLPDIVWCRVPGGAVTLEGVKEPFRVEPFFIAKHPVTWEQYRVFREAPDGYRNPRWWEGLYHDPQPGEQYRKYDNYPAENVSWYDAVAFCRWLSAKTGYEIRLPTEWEWQQAATGGDPARKYPWGAEWEWAQVSSRANTHSSGLNETTAVGMYPQGASPVGALDLAGNVWELCLNEHEPPFRVEPGGEAAQTVRGGSWFFHPTGAETRNRTQTDHPVIRNVNMGFRVCTPRPGKDQR
jgi:formylglycine-generating enzyme required for sulfatase activity